MQRLHAYLADVTICGKVHGDQTSEYTSLRRNPLAMSLWFTIGFIQGADLLRDRLFSVWGTFPCSLIHFGAKTSTLLSFGS